MYVDLFCLCLGLCQNTQTTALFIFGLFLILFEKSLRFLSHFWLLPGSLLPQSERTLIYTSRDRHFTSYKRNNCAFITKTRSIYNSLRNISVAFRVVIGLVLKYS